ncbi:hypothetical protein HO173_000766 [Letharia columbiana]|uniref:Efficient mitochondria targeting-associated protein 19 n=1 Tax=Letharia columbiana TaxID=112416 RepID=A0A8H6G5R9_9LECA|nr:uncharacterized protein HO173_000766 [Letharia columbiana]KAF6240973.1 hypothetical protein HO173_000766 [Letharia columbiana]
MAPSAWHRRLDLVYLAFFIIHVPIMFAVDLYPLYPLSLRPPFLADLRSWYIATYKDRFFTEEQPAWFWMFTVMEAGWHVPIGLTSIKPLWKGDHSPMLHLRLLLFAFQTALTTAVCVVEYTSWPELSAAEKSSLGGLYIPYLIFSLVMFADMYGRVKARLMATGESSHKSNSS